MTKDNGFKGRIFRSRKSCLEVTFSPMLSRLTVFLSATQDTLSFICYLSFLCCFVDTSFNRVHLNRIGLCFLTINGNFIEFLLFFAIVWITEKGEWHSDWRMKLYFDNTRRAKYELIKMFVFYLLIYKGHIYIEIIIDYIYKILIRKYEV